MVTKRDDDDDDNRQGEYRAICLLKVGRQSFAILPSCDEMFIDQFVRFGRRMLTNSGL